MVSLEKDLKAYFDRPCIVRSRSVDQGDVMKELIALSQGGTDLHKGTKKLWEDGFMDATRTRYKKPHSTVSEIMDEAIGIREHYPELFAVLKKSTLFSTLFMIPAASTCGVSAVSIDPSAGFLAFPRYSEKQNGTDYVVAQILKHNG